MPNNNQNPLPPFPNGSYYVMPFPTPGFQPSQSTPYRNPQAGVQYVWTGSSWEPLNWRPVPGTGYSNSQSSSQPPPPYAQPSASGCSCGNRGCRGSSGSGERAPVMPGVRVSSGWNYMKIGAQSPIVFLRSGSVRPWSNAFVHHAQNPNNRIIEPTMVPSNTTVKELLEGAGCTNSDKKKRVVTEVVPLGGGRWSRGLCISADEDRAKTKIADLGWDDTRTGELPNDDYTYLYITDDTKKGDL